MRVTFNITAPTVKKERLRELARRTGLAIIELPNGDLVFKELPMAPLKPTPINRAMQ